MRQRGKQLMHQKIKQKWAENTILRCKVSPTVSVTPGRTYAPLVGMCLGVPVPNMYSTTSTWWIYWVLINGIKPEVMKPVVPVYYYTSN